MRGFLYVLATIVVVGGPFWLAGKHRAHGELPAAFQRVFAPEVLAWEVDLGRAAAPTAQLGPLRVGQEIDSATLTLLGTGDAVREIPRQSHPAVRSDQGRPDSFQYACFALGLSIEGTRGHPAADNARPIISKMALGNPWATSVEDPLVKSCPFKFKHGIKFGMGVQEVEERLGDLVPRGKNQYLGWFRRSNALEVHLDAASFYYVDNQLVGVKLGR